MEREGNEDAGSTELWNEINTGLREHKAAKASAAMTLLDENEIVFLSHNDNVHLMIENRHAVASIFGPARVVGNVPTRNVKAAGSTPC